MNTAEFERLKEGDEIAVRARITAPMLSNEFHPDEPAHLEGWRITVGPLHMLAQPHDVVAVAALGELRVGDRVSWDGISPGWTLIHIIPETTDAVILHDLAGLGARRTALSRLVKVA